MTFEVNTFLLLPKRLLTVLSCGLLHNLFFSAVDSNNDTLFPRGFFLGGGGVCSALHYFPHNTALAFKSTPKDLTLAPSARSCRSHQDTGFVLAPQEGSYSLRAVAENFLSLECYSSPGKLLNTFAFCRLQLKCHFLREDILDYLI